MRSSQKQRQVVTASDPGQNDIRLEPRSLAETSPRFPNIVFSNISLLTSIFYCLFHICRLTPTSELACGLLVLVTHPLTIFHFRVDPQFFVQNPVATASRSRLNHVLRALRLTSRIRSTLRTLNYPPISPGISSSWSLDEMALAMQSAMSSAQDADLMDIDIDMDMDDQGPLLDDEFQLEVR